MANSILTIQGLSIRARGKPVLKDVHSSLLPTGLTALMGPVGTGKSTLLKWLCLKADPAIYTAELDFAEYFHGPLRQHNRPQLFAQRQGMTLDQAMLYLDVMLSANPALICLDEPTASMTPEEADLFLARLDILKQSRAFLVISHNQLHMRDHADHVLLLAGGGVYENTPASEFFSQARTEAGRQFAGTGWVAVPGLDTPSHHLNPELRETPDGLGLRGVGAEGRLRAVLGDQIFVYEQPERPEQVAADMTVLSMAGCRLTGRATPLAKARQSGLGDTGPRLLPLPDDISPASFSAVRAGCRIVQTLLKDGGSVAFLQSRADQDTAILVGMQLIFLGVRAALAAEIVAELLGHPASNTETENMLYDFELSTDLEKEGIDPTAYALVQPDISWIEEQVTGQKNSPG